MRQRQRLALLHPSILSKECLRPRYNTSIGLNSARLELITGWSWRKHVYISRENMRRDEEAKARTVRRRLRVRCPLRHGLDCPPGGRHALFASAAGTVQGMRDYLGAISVEHA